MKPFVIAGKASTVFKLIELKAKLEQEHDLEKLIEIKQEANKLLKSSMTSLREAITRCPFDPDACCPEPGTRCVEIDCPVLKGGRANGK